MTIHFPDLSHYKTPSLDGAVALITKATQGTAFVDATYAPYKRDADARGIPFAGYHWVDTSDLGAQAALAWRVMGGVPYLPRWWWQDHLGSPDLRPLRDAGLALVSSVYPKSGYTEQGVGWLPYGGVYPEIWQYTDAHPFNGQLVDFNAYRGTVEQLRQLLGLSSLAPEDDMLIRVNETGAIWTVDPARTWRRYVDGPEFKQAWAGQGYTSVPQAQVDAGWWGRDITTVATPGSASGGADEVRKIVDEELDEAFRGGADADS